MTLQTTIIGAVAIAAVSLATGFGTAWTVQKNKYELRISGRERELSQQAFKQLEVAHAETIRLQDTTDKAEQGARKREFDLVRLVGAVRSERDRLRDQLSATSLQLPQATDEAVRQYAAALTPVFGQCTERLEAVAREADGHASDSMKLQEAWPQSVR